MSLACFISQSAGAFCALGGGMQPPDGTAIIVGGECRRRRSRTLARRSILRTGTGALQILNRHDKSERAGIALTTSFLVPPPPFLFPFPLACSALPQISFAWTRAPFPLIPVPQPSLLTHSDPVIVLSLAVVFIFSVVSLHLLSKGEFLSSSSRARACATLSQGKM